MGKNLQGGLDLDQDGVNDLIAGSFQTWCSAISGRDGTFLFRFYNSRHPSSGGIGWTQAMVAAPPGEQYPLLIYSEREWLHPSLNAAIHNVMPGLLWCYRGSPKGVRAFGRPDAARARALPRLGMRDLPGPSVRFTLSDAAPAAAAVLLLGFSDQSFGGQPLPRRLDPLGWSGFTLQTSIDAWVYAATGASGNRTGCASYDLTLPGALRLDTTGTPLFAQWLWFDPSGPERHGSTAGHRFFVR
jgi:hypothetical protein